MRTGTANTASVVAALRRTGAQVTVTTEPSVLREAQRLVLPGVGSFGAAMGRLGELGPVLAERVRAGRPTLAVCLGLQLLFEHSDESPGVPGLAVLEGGASRFEPPVRVPQLGWNWVEPDAQCRLLEPGYAYYANSYRVVQPPAGWGVATSQHGGTFVAALERGPVLACQFHPELSGAWGLALLRRWIQRGLRAGA